MANISAPNVWSQMNYVPPRGQCNHKTSLLSPSCPCLRFMLHPLKSASSYECDGCGHHASFHSMENKYEDEIRKRWEMEEKERDTNSQNERTVAQPRKRQRVIEYGEQSSNGQTRNGRLLLEDNINYTFADLREQNGTSDAESSTTTVSVSGRTGTRKARGGKATKAPARRAPARGKGKLTEIRDDSDEYIQLD